LSDLAKFSTTQRRAASATAEFLALSTVVRHIGITGKVLSPNVFDKGFGLGFLLYLYLYPLGWHTLLSHANAEACLTLTDGPMRNPREGTSVVLRDTIRLT